MDAYYRRMCEPRPLRPRSKQEWLERRPAVREQALRSLGLIPLPDRLPLEARAAVAHTGEGLVVESVCWQTWPRVWAGGALYRPEAAEGRGPAVLLAGGDAALAAALARGGYTALVPEPEAVYAYDVGLTPLTPAVYGAMRALEYLQSRPEVERERLGVVGAGD
ncbi:MAG TPA: hypothetical protein VFU47_17010, partial [Armatimonadota bacterium]|nr:hypothetical protein [Armatimonadota bacterium]